jgi:hypothetical protein
MTLADMPIDADIDEEMDLRDVPDADMTPLVDMCQPMPRELACNNVCGMQADGCGGMIDCGEPPDSL